MDFDLDKVIAEETSTGSRKKKFSFKFDGKTYTLPNEIDTLAIAAAAEGDLLEALTRLLGAEQFEVIKVSPVVLTVPTLAKLLGAYYEHVAGLSVGESAASTRSSKSTAGPSKRTSKRTTKSVSRVSVVR